MNNRELRAAGLLFNPFEVSGWMEMRPVLYAFNNSRFWEDGNFLQDLLGHFAKAGSDISIVPPFFCDLGTGIFMGSHIQINTGLTILDEAPVTIGDHVLIGPHVQILTACHPLDAAVRQTDLEYCLPVTIEDNVWIGAGAIVNPGVTIGKGTVIGSGSVVTKSIPSGVIAAGNPCKIVRELTESDKAHWNEQYLIWKENVCKK